MVRLTRVWAKAWVTTVSDWNVMPEAWSGEVEPSQVWRASASSKTAILLVLAVDAELGCVETVPITFGSPRALAGSLHMPAALGHFGVPATAWTPLRRTFTWGVLDHALDEWPGTLVDWIRRPGGNPPAGCIVDIEMQDLLDPMYDERDDLELALDILQEESEQFLTLRNGRPLGFQKSPLKPTQIAQILDIPIPDATQIALGERPLSRADAATLSVATRQDLSSMTSAMPIPVALTVEIEHPRWRGDLQELAAKWSVSFADARQQLGRESFALAARTTAGTNEWRARVAAVVERERRA